ncbi:MAG TPA: hypothetical protein VI318_24930 [Baekduia sp.]
MLHTDRPALDLSFEDDQDPDEFVAAAMDWHFSPRTGSPFWLERARSLEFDPRSDIKRFEDLRMFPNVTDELRDVRVEDLIPKGYGPHPDVAIVGESGGTTGPPKRVVLLRDWWERMVGWSVAKLDERGVPRDLDWLTLAPTGPHTVGALAKARVAVTGGVAFSIDMDPRWVKRLIADGRAGEAEAYAEHLVDQAAFVLRTQDIGGLLCTPPLLERLARRDDLVEIIRGKVRVIQWTGAHMDADTRFLYRTDVFRDVHLYGLYGSTMVLGGADERPGLGDDDPCVFDPPSPFIAFGVVDPTTGAAVPYGQRGQVVMHHVSRSFLLPNNLERDMATRIEPPVGQAGDSVADVTPVARFGGEVVIEGVY